MAEISCEWCEKDMETMLLDDDGVKSSISGNPGTWCHAYDVYWWPCERRGEKIVNLNAIDNDN